MAEAEQDQYIRSCRHALLPSCLRRYDGPGQQQTVHAVRSGSDVAVASFTITTSQEFFVTARSGKLTGPSLQAHSSCPDRFASGARTTTVTCVWRHHSLSLSALLAWAPLAWAPLAWAPLAWAPPASAPPSSRPLQLPAPLRCSRVPSSPGPVSTSSLVTGSAGGRLIPAPPVPTSSRWPPPHRMEPSASTPSTSSSMATPRPRPRPRHHPLRHPCHTAAATPTA